MEKNKILKDLKYTLQFKLRPSQIINAGIGVFTLQDIPKDTIIFGGIKKNVFISWEEVEWLDDYVLKHIKSICLFNEKGFYIDDKLSQINSSYYINHSHEPNCHHDLQNDIYYSIRKIKKGEELTCYYLPQERDWNEK